MMKPTMNTTRKTEYLYIETEDIRMTVIGTLQPAGNGHVWLCSPDGSKRVFKIARRYVRRSSKEEMAQRSLEDRRHAMALRREAARIVMSN